MQWLRRSFIAGFFVTVPLVISVAAFIWIFRLIDGLTAPFYDAWLQRMPQLGITHVPGLGILTTALFVLLVGAVATNVIGKQLLQKTEGYLGDVIICARDKASFPDVTVEQGIQIFLTGGMALSSRMKARRGDDRVGDFRV